MIERTCLIIDNDDQSAEIEKLVRNAATSGINLECHQLSVGDPAHQEFLSDNKIDIDKVEHEFRQKFGNKNFDLVAFDYGLEDEKITGVELIRQLKARKLLRFSPKIVYSGLIDQILTEIMSGEKAVRKIKTLIKDNVLEYLDRDSRDPMILKILKENIQSTELIIAELMNEFPDLKFENNFVNKNYNGKTYGEIAALLLDDDIKHSEFKREIISQVISYLTEKI